MINENDDFFRTFIMDLEDLGIRKSCFDFKITKNLAGGCSFIISKEIVFDHEDLLSDLAGNKKVVTTYSQIHDGIRNSNLGHEIKIEGYREGRKALSYDISKIFQRLAEEELTDKQGD